MLRELEALGGRKALAVDWVRFLDDWKAAYRPGMDKVNRGESPWTTVDAIYRMRLGELLVAYGISLLATEEVNGRPIHLRPRLVAARVFRSDDAIPRQAG